MLLKNIANYSKIRKKRQNEMHANQYNKEFLEPK